MKALLPTLLLTVILFSCKKEKSPFVTDSRYIGTWELETVSTMAGSFHLPAGNGSIIVFGPTGSFERKENNAVTFQGTYSLKKKKDCSTEEKVFLLTSDYPNSYSTIIKMVDDKLVLTTSSCLADGGSGKYRKL